jgi:hypothetical protein
MANDQPILLATWVRDYIEEMVEFHYLTENFEGVPLERIHTFMVNTISAQMKEQFPGFDMTNKYVIEQLNTTIHNNILVVMANEDIQRFVPDPIGGIHLKGFSKDAQNVHRPSVMNTTEAAIYTLLKRPIPKNKKTILHNILNMFSVYSIQNDLNKDYTNQLCSSFENDYTSLEAFQTRYEFVVDQIWFYVDNHKYHSLLKRRFIEEIMDGLNVCANGKMAHLINVAIGFDDSIGNTVMPKEIFQGRFARLANETMENEKRLATAHELFKEFKISEEEQSVWLEALNAV